MIELNNPKTTRLGGITKPFANNNYARSLFGIAHPIFSTLGVAWKCLTAPSEISINTEQTKFTGRLILRALNLTSGTALLATATVAALQLAAVHWGVLATITTLLAGAGISIGSFGIVPLIMGGCLVIGFASAFLSNCLEKRALSKFATPALVINTRTNLEEGKALALLVLKTIILPWGICVCLKHVMQRLIMAFVHPAQVTNKMSKNKPKLHADQNEEARSAWKKECITPVTLEKNGVKYSGYTICHPNNKDNGNWTVIGIENNATAEQLIEDEAFNYQIGAGFNILIMNPPGVGLSQGTSTPESLGEVQDLALTYLKNKGAKKIALLGRSLGGAAIGQGILQHDFDPNIQYLAIPQMTFGSLSQTVHGIVKKNFSCLASTAASLIRLTGLEMNTVAASEKLAKLNIEEIVINRCIDNQYMDDGIISAEASLGHMLCQKNITQRKSLPTKDNPLDLKHNSREVEPYIARILAKWNQNLAAAPEEVEPLSIFPPIGGMASRRLPTMPFPPSHPKYRAATKS